MRALIVMLALARMAAADPAQLMAEALKSNDPAKLAACSQAYLDEYNKAPEDPNNDEVLYNAAACAQRARSVSLTVQTYQLIVKYFPRSKYAAPATLGLANAYAVIAFFDRAAAMFEQYSRKFAGEKDAADAAHNAILMRRLAGEDAKAIDDTTFFVHTFGRKLTTESADAEWALIPIYKKVDRTQATKAVLEYIRVYGAKQGADRLAAANRELGDLLRADTCPVPLLGGLCLGPSHVKARCGGLAVEPVRRDAKRVAAAYKSAPDDPWARLGIADLALEAAMAAKHGDKKLEDEYRDIAANTKDGAASIAAMARLGQLAEIDDCTGAAKAYGDCVAKASQIGVADRWSDLCYAGAHALDPKTYPADEVLPPVLAPRIDFDVIRTPELAAIYDHMACKPAAAAFHKLGTPEALVMEAVSLAHCGLDAEQPLRDAIKANGKLYAAHVDLAIVLMRGLPAATDRRKVIDDLRFAASNALAIDPPKPTAHLVLAALALADKQLEVAAYHIDTALRIDPKLAPALILRGMLSADDGNWTLAAKDFMAGALFDPLPSSLAMLRLRRYSAVTQPTYWGPGYEGIVGNAIAFRHTGQLDIARKLYEAAIKSAPTRAEAYYDLAVLEEASGDATKAKDLFAKAHAIDPSL